MKQLSTVTGLRGVFLIGYLTMFGAYLFVGGIEPVAMARQVMQYAHHGKENPYTVHRVPAEHPYLQAIGGEHKDFTKATNVHWHRWGAVVETFVGSSYKFFDKVPVYERYEPSCLGLCSGKGDKQRRVSNGKDSETVNEIHFLDEEEKHDSKSVSEPLTENKVATGYLYAPQGVTAKDRFWHGIWRPGVRLLTRALVVGIVGYGSVSWAKRRAYGPDNLPIGFSLTETPTYKAATVTGATFTGNLVTGVEGAVVWLEWTPTNGIGEPGKSETQVLPASRTPQAVNFTVNQMSPNSKYEVRLVAHPKGYTGAEKRSDSIKGFATLSNPQPFIKAVKDSTRTVASAQLSGTVNPNGSRVRAWFHYWSDGESEGRSTAPITISGSSSSVNITGELRGEAGQTYNYELFVEPYEVPGATVQRTQPQRVTLLSAPAAPVLRPASLPTAILLGGTVDAKGSSGEVRYLWRASSSDDYQESPLLPVVSAAAGGMTELPEYTATGLEQDATYTVQVVFTPRDGVATPSAPISVQLTPVLAPQVATLGTGAPSETAVQLQGTVNPQGTPALVWFDVWADDGSQVAKVDSQTVGGLAGTVQVIALVENLHPGKRYFYRLSAQSKGIKNATSVNGNLLSFNTVGPVGPSNEDPRAPGDANNLPGLISRVTSAHVIGLTAAVRHSNARVLVTCKGQRTCKGQLRLFAQSSKGHSQRKGHKSGLRALPSGMVGVANGEARLLAPKAQLLGAGRFVVGPRKTVAVTVKLSRSAVKKLRAKGKLKVATEITCNDDGVTTKLVRGSITLVRVKK